MTKPKTILSSEWNQLIHANRERTNSMLSVFYLFKLRQRENKQERSIPSETSLFLLQTRQKEKIEKPR